MNRDLKKILLSIVATFAMQIATSSTLETYKGVEQMRSTLYSIEVSQSNNKQQSFVYEDSNKFSSNEYHATKSNHWTNFSFEGGPVSVEITLLKGAKGEYEIRPLQKGIKFERKGDKITFTLTKPEKLYLWSDDKELSENPLFIFANEVDQRPKKGKDVVIWGDGVHEIGKHYTLKSNTTYYISGGAYLKGSFLSEPNAKNITVRGRGILSGELIEHAGYKQVQFDRMALRLLGRGETNFNVEGITFINPGQYCIQAYGGELHTSNVKCFGWWYETDGWVGGNNSTLKDSFFKVYDDIVKIYFDNLLVEDITIYKQNNGAVFQFGWSAEKSADAKARNIYVVKDDTAWNEKTMQGNRGFLNTATGNEKNRVERFEVSNVYYDGDLSYLLGIRTLGNYSGIKISNMSVRGEQRFKSYLSGGVINGVEIENLTINSERITSDKQIDLHTGGTIGAIVYK